MAKTKILALALGASVLILGACKTTPPSVETARFSPCEDVSVAIYFEAYSSKISRDARAVLKGAADASKGCSVVRVDVMGLADAVGASDANLKLSEQRAVEVTKTLTNLGLNDIRVAAAGDSGSVTRSGADVPMRRRADVILRLKK